MTELSPIELLTAIHAGPGAVVTFRAKAEGRMQDVASVRADKLRDTLPFIDEHLKTDAYFSINSTYQQEHARKSDLTGCAVYRHKEKHLRWLNALVVDLDAAHHGEQFSFGDLLDRFIGEIHTSGLPVPSIICESGRGLWALWLLRDHVNGGRVPAHKRPQAWHKRIGQAIARRFEHLGADVKCHDCARIMRVPGSINSRAPEGRNVVRFYRLSDAEYSLPEIAPHFGVMPRKIEITPRKKGPRDISKQAGAIARWNRCLAGFRQLQQIRGFFSEGSRHNAVYLLAVLLRYNRRNADEITRECLKLAASCKPPVTASEAHKRIKAASKVRSKLRHSTFIRMLSISAEEVAKLPIWFPPYRPKVSQKIKNRRDVLAEVINSSESIFSVRDAVHVLRARGFKASKSTIARDLQAIGYGHQRGASIASPPTPCYRGAQAARALPLRSETQNGQVSQNRCMSNSPLTQGSCTENGTVRKAVSLLHIAGTETAVLA